MAWNDPGDGNKDKNPWGGGKEPTPPDLDEALRSLKKRLNSIMGGNGGGVASKNNGGKFGVYMVIIMLLVLWALSGIFIVAPAERAVVLRFGKYMETLPPGPHWIPRFIDSKYVIDVERVSNFAYTSEMLNKDENIVSVSVAVQYRISNLRDYLFNVVNPSESLQQATASALRQVVGHTTLDEILTIGREKVRQDVLVLLSSILDSYQAGLTITDVAMQPARAPDEVKDAFDDAIKAQEDEQRFINQAKAYAARVEPIARGKAKRILEEAQAYKEQQVLQARGDVSKFLAVLEQYKRAPAVTRQRLYLDAIQKVFSNASKIVVDVKDGNNLLYLPLDRIINQSNLSEVSVASNTNQTQSTTEDSSKAVKQSGRLGRDSYLGRGAY